MAAIISTWKMSLAGTVEAGKLLENGAAAGDAVTLAVRKVEDDPSVTSVGYGGLPDMNGQVTLDAAYMDGDTLRMGGVIGTGRIGNPILAARALCGRDKNCLLFGDGAEAFAKERGLEMKDMRTDAALTRYRAELDRKNAPHGHDTVCVIALDRGGSMAVGTSTSGLFMKAPGRVGDTPLIGSGFYCDTRFGGAAATGLGEEIMRGCLSYEIVSLMRRGAAPADACLEALDSFMAGRRASGEEDDKSISVIAMAPDGRFGAASTLPLFPFAAGPADGVRLFAARGSVIEPVDPDKITGVD